MNAAWHAGLWVVALLAAASAHASGGTGEYPLPWPVPGEVLAYRACGCADGCWVAEVRQAKTRAVTARLRCDCEKLLFSRPGKLSEYTVAQTCSSINGSDSKPDAIRQSLERLLKPNLLE